MHAYIIEAPTEEERRRVIRAYCDDWNVQPFDTIELIPEELSIGIEAVRRFRSRLALVPTSSPWTVGIVGNATLLTIPAQQALLKTLEEPPPHVKLILSTPSATRLLPTIVSRAHIIRVTQQKTTDAENPVTVPAIFALQKSSHGQRLLAIDGYAKTGDEARLWIGHATMALQAFIETRSVSAGERERAAHLLRRFLLGLTLMEKNITPKLVLDRIFLENP